MTTCAIWIVLELLAWGSFAKPVLVVLLVVTAAATYFLQAYGIVIDRDMVTNIFQTDVAETRELLTRQLGGWMLLGGVMPAIVLAGLRIRKRPALKALAWKGAVLSLGALCILASAWPSLKSYTNVARNQRNLRWRLAPLNVMGATYGYAKRSLLGPAQLTAVGVDAVRLTPQRKDRSCWS